VKLQPGCSQRNSPSPCRRPIEAILLGSPHWRTETLTETIFGPGRHTETLDWIEQIRASDASLRNSVEALE
jgi:hypothetical protein